MEPLNTALRAIDPVVLGQRVRAARLARGLTQAQVGGPDASVAYVSRIESGQRRPDVRVLAAMASRLEITVDQLVDGRIPDARAEVTLLLDYAELALASGQSEEALAQSSEALARVEQDALIALQPRSLSLRACALEASGRIEEAIRGFEDLVAMVPRDMAWLRASIALSRCYRETGDLARAVEAGTDALHKLEQLGLAGSDEAVQLALTVAAAHYERGDVAHAIRLCQRAIEHAEELNSPKAKASAYWNASVMASKQGAVDAAIPLAKKAIVLLERADDARNIARLRSQLGICQLRLDPPDIDEAQRNLDEAAHELAWSSASPTDIARNQLAIGRAHFLSNDFAVAERHASETLDVAREHAPLLAADALVLQGQIAVRRSDLDSAKRHYREAILTLTGIGADRNAAQLWFTLGELLDQVGASEDAKDAYRRAAVSSGLAVIGTVLATV